MSECDRHCFLTAASMGALAVAMLSPTSVLGDGTEGMRIVNALGGLDDPNVPPDRSPADAGVERVSRRTLSQRVIDDARASGMNAVNVTLGYVAGAGDLFEQTLREIGTWTSGCAAGPDDLLKVLTAED